MVSVPDTPVPDAGAKGFWHDKSAVSPTVQRRTGGDRTFTRLVHNDTELTHISTDVYTRPVGSTSWHYSAYDAQDVFHWVGMGCFLLRTTSNELRWSTDGNEWAHIVVPRSSQHSVTVAFCNATHVFIVIGSRMFSSSDLTQWLPHDLPPTMTTPTFGEWDSQRNACVLIDSNGACVQSTDAEINSWEVHIGTVGSNCNTFFQVDHDMIASNGNNTYIRVATGDPVEWTVLAGMELATFHVSKYLETWVVSANAGCIVSRDNRATWTYALTGHFEGVATNGTTYVAVGPCLYAGTSLDQLQPVQTFPLPEDATWFGVTWNATAGLFIAVQSEDENNKHASYVSADGQTWTASDPLLCGRYIKTFGDITCVAGYNFFQITDTLDPLTWKPEVDVVIYVTCVAICENDPAIIVVAGSLAGISRSTDGGVTFAAVQEIDAASPMIWDIACGGDVFVVVGDHGYMRRSIDQGSTWSATITTEQVCLAEFHTVTYGGHHVFMAIDALHNVWMSTDDGATWNNTSVIPSGGELSRLRTLLYTGNQWIVTGCLDRVLYHSTDGIDWRYKLDPLTSNTIYDHDGTSWIAYNHGGVTQSTDMTTWTEYRPRGVCTMGMVVGGAAYYVQGSFGTIVKTTDGQTFDIWGLSTMNPIGFHVWADDESVLVVGDTFILRSTDKGATWMQVASAPTHVSFRNNDTSENHNVLTTDGASTVLIRTNSSRIMRSIDKGIAWSIVEVPMTFLSLGYDTQSTFYASSNTAAICLSKDLGLSWTTQKLPQPTTFGATMVAITPTTVFTAEWTESHILVSRSMDEGLTWSTLPSLQTPNVSNEDVSCHIIDDTLAICAGVHVFQFALDGASVASTSMESVARSIVPLDDRIIVQTESESRIFMRENPQKTQ